jgi:hypothetical protein
MVKNVLQVCFYSYDLHDLDDFWLPDAFFWEGERGRGGDVEKLRELLRVTPCPPW